MIERNVFSSGRYIEHFQPDDTHNPFHRLYSAKRADVIGSIRSSLPAGGTVLDLGGGSGRMAVFLAKDYTVTLCDISPDMLRMAEIAGSERGIPAGNLTIRQADAAKPLPLPTHGFDRALCIDLLVHVVDPLVALRELHRVLKPTGELLVDVTNRSPWWILRYPRCLGRQPSKWLRTWKGGGILPEWQGIVRHYRYAEYERLLSTAGFAAVQEWRYGPSWCPKWFLTRCRPMEG